MYIVVTDTATYQATTDVGTLAQINGVHVDSVRCFAGPWRGDAVVALSKAFPNAFILTNQPIPPGIPNCFYLPSANFVSFSSPRVCQVAGAKGGVGKTSLSALMAFCLAKRGLVCVVDCDEQAGFTTMCNISGKEEYSVRLVAPNVLLVPNRRGEPSPISKAPPDVVGAALGAHYVIVDYGNRGEVPKGENAVLVTGVGEDIFRLTVPLLRNFRGVVAIMPTRNERKDDKEKMRHKIIGEGIPPQKVVVLPYLPYDIWRPSFPQVESVASVPEVYRSVWEVIYATGMVESAGETGGDRGKRRFFGL